MGEGGVQLVESCMHTASPRFCPQDHTPWVWGAELQRHRVSSLAPQKAKPKQARQTNPWVSFSGHYLGNIGHYVLLTPPLFELLHNILSVHAYLWRPDVSPSAAVQVLSSTGLRLD